MKEINVNEIVVPRINGKTVDYKETMKKLAPHIKETQEYFESKKKKDGNK